MYSAIVLGGGTLGTVLQLLLLPPPRGAVLVLPPPVASLSEACAAALFSRCMQLAIWFISS